MFTDPDGTSAIWPRQTPMLANSSAGQIARLAGTWGPKCAELSRHLVALLTELGRMDAWECRLATACLCKLWRRLLLLLSLLLASRGARARRLGSLCSVHDGARSKLKASWLAKPDSGANGQSCLPIDERKILCRRAVQSEERTLSRSELLEGRAKN